MKLQLPPFSCPNYIQSKNYMSYIFTDDESSPTMLVFTQTRPKAHSKQKGLRSYFSTEIGSMDPNTPGV